MSRKCLRFIFRFSWIALINTIYSHFCIIVAGKIPYQPYAYAVHEFLRANYDNVCLVTHLCIKYPHSAYVRCAPLQTTLGFSTIFVICELNSKIVLCATFAYGFTPLFCLCFFFSLFIFQNFEFRRLIDASVGSCINCIECGIRSVSLL